MTLNIINYLSNMDSNSKLLLIVIAVISVLLILIFIFNFLSNRKIHSQAKMKRAYEKKLLAEIEEESKNIDVPKKTSFDEESVVKPNIEKIEPEEVIEVLQDDNESDIDRILRDIKEASLEDTMNLTQFEKEQEETAIISYDELCKRAGVQKKVYKAPSKKDEPVVIQKDTYNDKTSDEKPKYKPSKIVSPIFGIQEEKKGYVKIDNTMDELELEQTFLTNLKEFRSGLDS